MESVPNGYLFSVPNNSTERCRPCNSFSLSLSICISLLPSFSHSFVLHFLPINHICSHYRGEGRVTLQIGVLISRNDLTHTRTCVKIKQPICLPFKYPCHLARRANLIFPAFCTFPGNWIVHLITERYLCK